MATTVGTYDISTLLATRFTSAAEFGLDTIQQVVAADLLAHNQIVNEMVGQLCELTTDRQRIYGTSEHGDMVEVDEYGRAPTQVILPGATVGFPMRLFQYALGWTRKWFETHTPAELASAVLKAEEAHMRRIRYELQRAIFLSSNYSFPDFLVDKVSLPVKRLVNADGASIPDGPNGETFDGSTHTHYNATSSFVAADLTALIQDVVEHGFGGGVRVGINRAQEAAVKALTGFTGYADPRIIYRATDTPGRTLDITRLDNRAIGIFDAAEIWVKPWIPANYMFAWDASSPAKPIAFRQRNVTALQGLRIASTIEMYPLHAEYMEAEFGTGIWTRTNGAALYIGGASYTDPTLTP